MSDKHPYTTATGNIVKVIDHLRRSFPTTVTADTLRKLGYAPKNESYIINILRFLGLIDQDGNKTDLGSRIFSEHDNDAFAQQFSNAVTQAYADLFDLQGESAWNLDTNALITFFRRSDGTTDIVGKYQARTFKQLAAFAGHGEQQHTETSTTRKSANVTKKTPQKISKSTRNETGMSNSPPPGSPSSDNGLSRKRSGDIALTVRIEINLPADGDQQTYDRIFKSIRDNFIND